MDDQVEALVMMKQELHDREHNLELELGFVREMVKTVDTWQKTIEAQEKKQADQIRAEKSLELERSKQSHMTRAIAPSKRKS